MSVPAAGMSCPRCSGALRSCDSDWLAECGGCGRRWPPPANLMRELAEEREGNEALERALGVERANCAGLRDSLYRAGEWARDEAKKRRAAESALADVKARLAEAEGERDDLAAAIEATVKELLRKAEEGEKLDVCGYCGAVPSLNTSDLKAHVVVCPENPAVRRASTLKARLRRVLRACQTKNYAGSYPEAGVWSRRNEGEEAGR